MAQILRQSTAVDVLIGPFVDLTDGATAEEAETPTVLLSKNGQALGAKSDVTVPVHDDAGYYNCEFDVTDTNTVGTLILIVEKSATALPVRHEFQVVEEVVYDAMFAASAALDPAITEPAGVFTWPSTVGAILGWLGAISRNKITQTDALETLRNDADGANIATAVVNDNGTTATRSEWT